MDSSFYKDLSEMAQDALGELDKYESTGDHARVFASIGSLGEALMDGVSVRSDVLRDVPIKEQYEFKRVASAVRNNSSLSGGRQNAPLRSNIEFLKSWAQRASEKLSIMSAEPQVPTAAPTSEAGDLERSNDIFIVHGHDGEAREAVARFISAIGLNPIVLSEKANQGKTVIEKFEAHSGAAGFAVVLVTPDDEGRKVGTDDLRRRARQNVILELGYFMGALGRDKVCAMATTRDVELPSDLSGIITEPFDGAGPSWKMSLVRELRAAGYDIDWNKVMQ